MRSSGERIRYGKRKYRIRKVSAVAPVKLKLKRDWKKTKVHGAIVNMSWKKRHKDLWETKNRETVVHIRKNALSSTYAVILWRRNKYIHLGNFRTKSQALKFAKQYMRSH